MNVVILEVAWGRGADYFRINPRNFTGRRLYSWFGSHRFLVTNACPEVVNEPSGRGTPDPARLRRILAKLDPSFVLVCGSVAKKTFAPDMVRSECFVHHCSHPAARTWTKADLVEMRAVIQSQLG